MIRLLSRVTAHEAFLRAQSMGLSWAAVRAPEENLAFEHYQERGYWTPVEQPEIGKTLTYPRGLFASDDLGVRPERRAPHLGEHTRAILAAELGFADAEVDTLVETGVVR